MFLQTSANVSCLLSENDKLGTCRLPCPCFGFYRLPCPALQAFMMQQPKRHTWSGYWYLIFCAVCDELMLGIPHFAWWVGIAALLCIALAALAPLVLPLHKLLNCEGAESSKANAAKMSWLVIGEVGLKGKNAQFCRLGNCTHLFPFRWFKRDCCTMEFIAVRIHVNPDSDGWSKCWTSVSVDSNNRISNNWRGIVFVCSFFFTETKWRTIFPETNSKHADGL